jgi:hypothetical protein
MSLRRKTKFLKVAGDKIGCPAIGLTAGTAVTEPAELRYKTFVASVFGKGRALQDYRGAEEEE